MPIIPLPDWNAFIQAHPEAHLLQTAAWGELKSAFGWTPVPVLTGGMGALILFRKLPLGQSVAYIPRGPVGAADERVQEQFWAEMDSICRKNRAAFLKIEPDRWENDPDNGAAWSQAQPSARSIQPRRTVVVDIRGKEADILSRMKQKTRYNIRLAEKKGVQIHVSADVAGFFRLMESTGKRDCFGIHALAYYQAAYRIFNSRGACELLMAEAEGQALAGLMVFWTGKRAWYLYGASSDAGRNLMPTYLLQWEAIRAARSHGCETYDLYGVPDVDEQALESQFENRSDGLWGVYRFKRGFGGEVKRASQTLDRVYNPLAYWLYQKMANG